MKRPIFFKKINNAYLVGIKGVGMTALACCLQDMGIKISGSDVGETFVTDQILKERKINWKIGFLKQNLNPLPDLVITTGAHGGLNNPEVKMAQQKKIPVLTQAQAVGKIMEGKKGISVCGVGGKTTTSAMIATILETAKRKPSYAIGVAKIYPLGVGGKYDEGKEFIAEADEYVNSPGIDNTPKFYFQNPQIIVVSNIEYDHPDVYSNLQETKKIFRNFFKKIPKNGLLLACIDNPHTWETVKKFSGNLQTYGFSSKADFKIENVSFKEKYLTFDILRKKILIKKIKIKVPGKFNILNATAAFAVGLFLGVRIKTIKDGLQKFAGSKRRFEFIGKINDILIYDDYAHHPKEIEATLQAAKMWFPSRRIIVIFQPHTFSRTKALLSEFAQAFHFANIVIVTKIYASAREKNNLGISGKMLEKEIKKYHPYVLYKAEKKGAIEFLKKITKPGDVIFTLGAGDIFQWHKNILNSLKN